MHDRLRIILLLLVAAASLAGVMSLPPIAQAPSYHAFVDQRAVLGIPNFLNVVSNLPFLIIGAGGVWLCREDRRRSWLVFFCGVALIGIGSAYYHCVPNDRTLVWDRLPMTMGFMGILVAVLGERVSERLETHALLPAVLAGAFSVLWWVRTGDLRMYLWVQLLPLIVLPAALGLFPGQRANDRLLVLSLLCYLLAKIAEQYDHAFYWITEQAVSGHTLKHFLAAAGCAVLLYMRERSGLPGEAAQQLVSVRCVRGGE